MINKQQMVLGLFATAMMQAIAAEQISFDRPSTGVRAVTAPVGMLIWEQALPSARYNETFENGQTTRDLTLQSDLLLRTGLAKNLELQLSWDGLIWQQQRRGGQRTEQHGLGDVGIGLKKQIELEDERVKWALLAEAKFNTGEAEFREDHDHFALGSVFEYQMHPEVALSMYTLYQIDDAGHLAATVVPTMHYQIQGAWSGFSEYVFRKQESEKSEGSLNTGIMYRVNPRTQLDASVGFGLKGDVPDYTAGLGLSMAF